jgi:hypothetical protein
MRVGYAGATIPLAAKLPVGTVEPALAERQLWAICVDFGMSAVCPVRG